MIKGCNFMREEQEKGFIEECLRKGRIILLEELCRSLVAIRAQ